MKTPKSAATCVALALLFGIGATSMSAAKTFVYVSNAQDGNIDAYAMDAGSGALTPIGKTEAAKLVMPMTVSPSKKYLYAVIRSQPTREAFEASPSGDPYAGAIAIMDAQIGRLLTALEKRQQLERTAIVVTADHGESLGDHGEQGHGIFVYESALRVPLIVRWPGVTPRRVTDLAQIIDIAPTVLDLEGLPGPAMEGVSLSAVMRGRGVPPDRIAYAESMYPLQYGWGALRAVRQGRFKFIEAPRPELYDLESDPDEARNLHETQPATSARLLTLVRTFGPAELSASPPGDDAAKERLAALGYAGSHRSPVPPSAPAVWPDPKDMIGVYNDLVEQRLKRQ